MSVKIIILKGTSSSGKTSIAKALQKQLDEAYLHFQMDAFWDMVPEDMEANSQNFPKLRYAVIDSAKSLAENGHNLIMDITLMPDSVIGLMNALKGHYVFSVGVHCDLEILKKRERQRGDRKIGLAESQYETIHDGVNYDFEINTSKLDAKTVATSIVTAFRRT
tara:strand:- start:326 stop:817 length:492 start_codon:yes stop_codon:yes gene_type:complete